MCKKTFRRASMYYYGDDAYCWQCFPKKLAKVKFERFVKGLFNLTQIPPSVWKEYKNLITCGFSNDTIIETIYYIYTAKKVNQLMTIMKMINEKVVEEMTALRKERKMDAN